LCACSSPRHSSTVASNTTTASSSAPPSEFEDNFVQLQRLSTSTFIEILEVRARDANTVMFCSAVQGLNIVDVSDPAHMKVTHKLASSLGSQAYPRCQHLAFSGDVVYISNRGDEIQPTPFVTAFNVAGSSGKELASYTAAGASFEGMTASGDHLYVAMHDEGVRVLQLAANKGALSVVGSVSGLTNAWSVAHHDGMLYVADGPAGLAIVDVGKPAAPQLLSHAAIDGAAQFVELDPATRTAYVAAGGGGLVAIDVSNTQAPKVVAVAETPGSALQVALTDGYAFVADWNDVRVFDRSSPDVLKLIATERIDTAKNFSRVLGIAVYGTHAYLGEWTGLYSYELDPSKTAPDINVQASELDFGVLSGGAKGARALIISNEGQEPLQAQLSVQGAGYGSADAKLQIAAGKSASVELLLTAPSDAVAEGSLTISSNDPDESERSVGLVANRPGLGVGDPAPAVNVQLLNGGSWSLAEQQGKVVVLAYFATF